MSLSTIIVDDEPLARKGLAIRLKAHDDIHVIEQCCNGREALEAIRAYQVDLMFLDIQMPGLSGFQVIENFVENFSYFVLSNSFFNCSSLSVKCPIS